MSFPLRKQLQKRKREGGDIGTATQRITWDVVPKEARSMSSVFQNVRFQSKGDQIIRFLLKRILLALMLVLASSSYHKECHTKFRLQYPS